MQSDRKDDEQQHIRLTCAQCGVEALETVPVVHHLSCAYVGPEYDFKLNASSGMICPKCRTELEPNTHDWEIVGRSYRCGVCAYEDV